MAYAIRANGTVMGWGRNDEGQLADGTSTRRLTPVRVGTLTGVVAIAGGRDHGLAVRQRRSRLGVGLQQLRAGRGRHHRGPSEPGAGDDRR